MRDGQQIVFSRGPGATDGGANASSLAGYFLISNAGTAHLKFVGAVSGKDQVGMRVDKAGSHDSAAGVDDLSMLVRKASMRLREPTASIGCPGSAGLRRARSPARASPLPHVAAPDQQA